MAGLIPRVESKVMAASRPTVGSKVMAEPIPTAELIPMVDTKVMA